MRTKTRGLTPAARSHTITTEAPHGWGTPGLLPGHGRLCALCTVIVAQETQCNFAANFAISNRNAPSGTQSERIGFPKERRS